MLSPRRNQKNWLGIDRDEKGWSLEHLHSDSQEYVNLNQGGLWLFPHSGKLSKGWEGVECKVILT